MKKLALLLSLLPAIAFAQSSPNWPLGYNPSVAEINAAFAGKLDTGTSVFTGSFNGPVGNVTPSTGAFTTIGMTGPIGFSGSQPWTGTSPTQALLNAGAGITFSGSMGAAGNVGLGAHFNINDTIDAHLNVGGDVAAGLFQLNYYQNARGGGTGLIDTLVIPASQVLTDLSAFEFVAGRDFVIAGSSSNGQAHSLIGRTTAVQLLPAAAGYGQAVGQEIAMGVQTGATVTSKALQYLMLYSYDAVRGSGSDRIQGMWSQNAQSGANNAKVALDVGPQGQSGLFFPLGTDGVILQASKGASDGSLTIATGIDLTAISTFSSNIFNTGVFKIDGSGFVHTNEIIPFSGTNFGIYNPSAAPALNVVVPASIASYLQVVAVASGGGAPRIEAVSSGSGADLGLSFQTGSGNTAAFQFLDSALAVDFKIGQVASPVSYAVVTPAASGNILFDVGGTGTGISIGGTTATSVKIGSATADQVHGSGTFMPALNSTTGFIHLPFTNASSGAGGIPTGTPSNTQGPACEWNAVTFVLNCYDPGAAAWKHVSFSANAG